MADQLTEVHFGPMEAQNVSPATDIGANVIVALEFLLAGRERPRPWRFSLSNPT